MPVFDTTRLEDLAPSRPLFLAVAGIFVWAGYKLARYGQREAYLPPGPPTKPLVGNLHLLPKKGGHYQFAEWASQYGDIFSLKLAHKTLVVLSSYEAIHHVLDKNSAFSSDRPSIHIKERIEGQNNNVAMYGLDMVIDGVPSAAQLNKSSPPTPADPISASNKQKAPSSCTISSSHPRDVRTHLRRTSTSVINSVMFGLRFPTPSSPLYLSFWQMLELAIRLSSPTEHPPVDLFPFLKHIPERWASWKGKCRELKERHEGVLGEMLRPVEERLERGVGNGAFMEEVYLRAGEWNLDHDALRAFGYVMMAAGAETTSTFLQIFILCIAAHPEVLPKLHEEMDRVVGTDRGPELDDFERLEYLRAVVAETTRFRPVIPLGVPHAAIEDIQYKNYVIPKGSIIFQNSWSMFRDSNIWKEPERFNPDRFVEEPELHKYPDYAFGSGRRACVGIHLAHSAIKLNAMNLVYYFNIAKALDTNGDVIEPNLHFCREGVVQSPEEVNVSLKPRSKHHEEVLRKAFRDSEEAFRPFEYNLGEEERREAREMRRGA